MAQPYTPISPRNAASSRIENAEVLRGQEDRDAACDEVADRLPHDPTAAWIEARRRLVEEDDPRIADEGHGQVKRRFMPPE